MSLFSRTPPVATVAFNMKPLSGPYGGGNQWVRQLSGYLRQYGYAIRFDLAKPVDCLMLTHAGISGTLEFGAAEIRDYKRRHPQVCCIQRINDNDQRKGTKVMNAMLAETNALADHTVFLSDWLRDHHVALWFDRNLPHSTILNGADPAAFHPIGSRDWREGEPLRLVTHHWADNWMKGFAVYREIDELIAAGQLPGAELWIIGRWPQEIQWKRARTFPPVRGAALGALLRQCHVYITASLHEPGGMHFIEGVQCGLPLVYHEDGGGIVELGCKFGIGFRDQVVAALAEMRQRYAEFRQRAVTAPPSGDEMCLAYRRVLQGLIATHRASGEAR